MQSQNPRELVVEDVQRATSLVNKITAPNEEIRSSLPKGVDMLPVRALQQCQGLAFTSARKGGIGLSIEQGHGFVIAKMEQKFWDPKLPKHVWSAPLFIHTFASSLGLSLGYSEIDSVIVLGHRKTVDAFLRTQVTIDSDVSTTLGDTVSVNLPGHGLNLSELDQSIHACTFSISKGAMVDISLSGMNYSVDVSTNVDVYGMEFTPEAVLGGQFRPPSEMNELYSTLEKISSGS